MRAAGALGVDGVARDGFFCFYGCFGCFDACGCGPRRVLARGIRGIRRTGRIRLTRRFPSRRGAVRIALASHASISSPGFGPETGLPFLSPELPLAFPAGASGGPEGSGESEGSNGLSAKPHVRVLEAPLEALTESDFTTSLERFAASRNNLEEEIDFLTDIEGDPDDINELREALDALDERIRATAERFEAWRAAEKKRDEERGASN